MDKEESIKYIEQEIIKMANDNNWQLTDNISKIAKAKYRLSGVENWKKCPCYPKEDTEHGCGTEACTKMINEDGICHCQLYRKRD